MERKRAFSLLPLKALVNDKHRHFTKTYQPFGLRVIRATGEIAVIIPALMRGQYDICLMTYEKFASLAIGCPHILEQIGTVVVDEVQMIADESRGANLEFVLTLRECAAEPGSNPNSLLCPLSSAIRTVWNAGFTRGCFDELSVPFHLTKVFCWQMVASVSWIRQVPRRSSDQS